MLGERTFSEQIHQGENGVLYVESITDKALLVLIFDSSVPLGKVKLYAKRTIGQLTEVLENAQDAPKIEFDQGFSDSAGALLDDLFG